MNKVSCRCRTSRRGPRPRPHLRPRPLELRYRLSPLGFSSFLRRCCTFEPYNCRPRSEQRLHLSWCPKVARCRCDGSLTARRAFRSRWLWCGRRWDCRIAQGSLLRLRHSTERQSSSRRGGYTLVTTLTRWSGRMILTARCQNKTSWMPECSWRGDFRSR